MQKTSGQSPADCLPIDLIHRIFSHLTTPADLSAAALINKHWYGADGTYRRTIKVVNCFAISPTRLTRRFHALNSLTLVARPDVLHGDKFTNVNWRVSADRWIECVSSCYGGLRELRLKRFVVSHRSTMLISRSFPELRSLIFVGCVGIPGFGLGSIVASCRFLEVLELKDCSGMSRNEPWLTDFPENCESLVSLSFVNVKGVLDIAVLERLVTRCRNLKCLKFDEPLPREVLIRFLKTAPQLVELGFGTVGPYTPVESQNEFEDAVMNCTSVQSLSGTWSPHHLSVISTLCTNLLFLDVTKIESPWFNRLPVVARFIEMCHNLQRLWVHTSLGDRVLRAVGRTCKELHELRVVPSHGRLYFANARHTIHEIVTLHGLADIVKGCHKLQSVTYCCKSMSNNVLVSLARQNPDIRKFELILPKPEVDVDPSSSLDEGFGAILQNCRNLHKLSIRNAYVTDQVFFYAGMYGLQLKKLYVQFGGDSSAGIFHALNQNIKQLMIRGPFGDAALFAAAEKLKNLQFVWVNSRGITVEGVEILRESSFTLSVDIMDQIGQARRLPPDMEVQNLLIYHKLGEPHQDMEEP